VEEEDTMSNARTIREVRDRRGRKRIRKIKDQIGVLEESLFSPKIRRNGARVGRAIQKKIDLLEQQLARIGRKVQAQWTKQEFTPEGPLQFKDLWDGANFICLRTDDKPLLDYRNNSLDTYVKLWTPRAWTIDRTDSPFPLVAVSIRTGHPIHLPENQKVLVVK
jgi:hypothetical protein